MPSAVVTGGSSGIGAAVMHELEVRGVRCYDFSRSTTDIDVTFGSDITFAYDEIVGVEGPPEFLVANAGVSTPGDAFPDDDSFDWFRTFETNLHGTYYVCKEHAARLLEAGKTGRIVIISSSSARRPSLENLAYGVSKAAVESLGLALASGLEKKGIQVHVLQPAFIDTPMIRRRWGDNAGGHKLIPVEDFAKEVVRYLLTDTYTDGHVISYGAELWMKQR